MVVNAGCRLNKPERYSRHNNGTHKGVTQQQMPKGLQPAS